MPKNITISISDELEARLNRFQEANRSEICRKALQDYVDERENPENQSEMDYRYGGPSWRTQGYKDFFVTVNAKLGEYGPKDWNLKVKSGELKKPLTIELGNMTQLDRIIRGVADYFWHQYLTEKHPEVDVKKIATREMLSDLWICTAKWARKNKLDVHADVALLPSESISVRGMQKSEDFVGAVTPKDWGNVTNDEGKINVFSSNFWITREGTFRLSSYLTKLIGSDASAANCPVDFNPDNQEQENEIRQLLSRASVIYMPDLSLKNVRAIFF